MISEYHLEEIHRHEDYINNLTIYEYNVSKIKDEWYNGDRTHGIMALLDADANEFETMGTGDEMMDRFKKEVKHMNSQLGDVQFRDPDEDAEIIFNTILDNKKKEAARQGREEGLKEGRAEGLAEGLAEGQIQTKNHVARKMKLKGIDIDMIADITGLSLDEINDL